MWLWYRSKGLKSVKKIFFAKDFILEESTLYKSLLNLFRSGNIRYNRGLVIKSWKCFFRKEGLTSLFAHKKIASDYNLNCQETRSNFLAWNSRSVRWKIRGEKGERRDSNRFHFPYIRSRSRANRDHVPATEGKVSHLDLIILSRTNEAPYRLARM